MQKAIITDGAPAPRGFYSQGIHAGSFVFVSGQLPIDIDGSIVGSTAAEQTRQALANVEAVLRASGASLKDIVQVNVYVAGIDLWPEVNRAYEESMAHVPVPPARAVVPVKELHYGALVEIQAIAYLSGS